MSGVSCGPGDVLKIADNGSGAITLSKNGAAEVTVTDTTYKGGSPGLGFYIENLNAGRVGDERGLQCVWRVELHRYGRQTGSGSTGGGTGSGGTTLPTVTVSWTAALPGTDPAVSYDIYRGGAEIGSATGTSYVDSSVVAGATYTYCVTSVDASGNQSTQACAAAVTIPVATQTTPNPPTNVTATPN